MSLQVVVDLPAPAIAQEDTVVGVDLGVHHPAVTASRHFFGPRRWKALEQRRFRLRRALHSTGTRSAKRHLHTLSGQQLRFQRECDHLLSRRIAQSSPAGSTIVLDNLTYIRQRVRQRQGKQQRRVHRWRFAQLAGLITSQGQERGQRVVFIDPRQTSQTCSRCGAHARTNRRSQALFSGRHPACGCTLTADLNASDTIRNKHAFQPRQDFGSWAVVKRPLVSSACRSGTSPALERWGA